MQIINKPVRNYSSGRNNYKPEAVVIHIAEGYLAGAHSWFNNPNSKASSHYMVGRSGAIWRFVDEKNTAWHAGGVNKPTWGKIKRNVNPNLYTIGIEHEGFTGEKWTADMLAASCELTADICQRWDIQPSSSTIIGHNEINSVTRSRCPGPGINLESYINRVKDIINSEDKLTDMEREELNRLREENLNLKTRINLLNKEIESLRVEDDNALTLEISNLQQQVMSLNIEIDKLRKENRNLKGNSSNFFERLKNIFK